MAIKTVGVLGCGLMGAGIAQVCAQAGHPTIVREVDEPTLQKGMARIRKFLETGIEKGKVTLGVNVSVDPAALGTGSPDTFFAYQKGTLMFSSRAKL